MMTRRANLGLMLMLAGIVLARAPIHAAWAAFPDSPSAQHPEAEQSAPPLAGPDRPAAKPKSRRVVIFGTTIVGDVLKPPIETTVPWQSPPAFRTNAAPLSHDFTRELLTPLNRDQLVPDAGDHAH